MHTLARTYSTPGRYGKLVHNPHSNYIVPGNPAGNAQAPYFAGYLATLVRAYAVAKALPVPASLPAVVLLHHTGKTIVYRVAWHAGSNVVARVALSASNPARYRVLRITY